MYCALQSKIIAEKLPETAGRGKLQRGIRVPILNNFALQVYLFYVKCDEWHPMSIQNHSSKQNELTEARTMELEMRYMALEGVT